MFVFKIEGMKSIDAIEKMNEYGNKSIPFLFIIDFECKNFFIEKLVSIDSSEVLYDLNGVTNAKEKIEIEQNIVFNKYTISFSEYNKALQFVLKNINYGNSYLTNLTFPTPIECNLSLKQIFYRSKAKYKLLFKNQFVVFSPEIFVTMKDGEISSYPMKGTIDANIENAEQTILDDPKESAEHTTIVDLIRNDLSMVSKKVRVEKFRYIDEIKTNNKTLLQVSSKIVGNLPDDFQGKIGDIIFTLLPAGSICGAPKKKTVEIIKEAESYDRGFYTGIMGLFDGKNLDSAVMIRFIEQINNKLVYKSGGGITSFSDVEKEYNELIDKVYLPL